MTKRLLACFSAFFLLLTLVTGLAAQAQASVKVKTKIKGPVTTVYLVRHAEKDTAKTDPALSPVGLVRAQALSTVLARRHPVALFTTDTRRTRATLAPLAAATKLEPQVYDPKQDVALAARISKEYVGKTVVIVGHSNTLLPLIESLGGVPPVEEIGDDEYDYLFTVRLVEGISPTVGVRGYGPERKLAAAARAQNKAAAQPTSSTTTPK